MTPWKFNNTKIIHIFNMKISRSTILHTLYLTVLCNAFANFIGQAGYNKHLKVVTYISISMWPGFMTLIWLTT